MTLIYLATGIDAIEIYEDGKKIWTEYLIDDVAGRIFIPITASIKLSLRGEAFRAEIKLEAISTVAADTTVCAREVENCDS